MSGLSLWAQRPVVHTRLTPDTIKIGDQMLLEVVIDKDQAQEIQIPQFDNNMLSPQLEIIGEPRYDTVKSDGRNISLRLSYTLTSFDAGEHSFGGFPIVYSAVNIQDTVESEDVVRVVVQTFDIDTTKMDIADIKKPLETPLQWVEIKDIIYWGLAGAVVLAVILYFVIRWYKSRKRKIAIRRAEPAHITAIRELEKLSSEKLWQGGHYKEYYSRISDILRVYLEARYGIWAMEMITSEILASVRDVNNEQLQNKLRELFTLADLVKFAKLTPSAEECQDAFTMAYYYVEETKLMTIETPDNDE